MIALPYGPNADWVRNVLAAGSATILHDGSTVPVRRPEVMRATDVVSELPPSERRTLRLFRVDHCLRVQRAPAVDAQPA